MFRLKRNEGLLLGSVLVLLVTAILGPSVLQPVHQHDFADHRLWGRLPFALDVLSNLPFALWGMLGMACVWSLVKRERVHVQHVLATLFFAGLLLTAAASSWYHWSPNDVGLAADRLGMTVAFAGLSGLAAAGRVSPRAGLQLAVALLVLGPLSVCIWFVSGNVLPWLVLQFGGMVLILWLACIKPLPGAFAIRWGFVILIYAAAKLLELADHQVFALTSQVISGHSLKHLVASCAAWPVLAALVAPMEASTKSGQNHFRFTGTGHPADRAKQTLSSTY